MHVTQDESTWGTTRKEGGGRRSWRGRACRRGLGSGLLLRSGWRGVHPVGAGVHDVDELGVFCGVSVCGV